MSSPPPSMLRRALGLLTRAVKAVWGALVGIVKGIALAAVVVLVAYGVVYAFWMLVPRSPAQPTPVPGGSFAFAALGDAPYSPVEFELFDVVLEDLAQHDLGHGRSDRSVVVDQKNVGHRNNRRRWEGIHFEVQRSSADKPGFHSREVR